MSFPLISFLSSTSLLEAVFEQLNQKKARERPALIPLIRAIDALIDQTSMDPGNASELKKSVKLLHPHQLIDEDRKVVQLFIEKIVSRSLAADLGPPSLIEALATLKIENRPSLAKVMRSSLDLIAMTGLQPGNISTWDFWLKDLYPESDFTNLDQDLAAPFEVMALISAPAREVKVLPGVNDGEASRLERDSEYFRVMDQLSHVTSCERLTHLLSQGTAGCEKKSLQGVLNALLAEASMVEQLQRMLLEIQGALRIDAPDFSKADEILGRMWQSNDDLLRIGCELEKAESGEEFGLVLRTYQRLNAIQSPYFADDPKLSQHHHRVKITLQCLQQIQILKEDLQKIAKTSADWPDSPMMDKLAASLAGHADTVKGKLICAMHSDAICDLFKRAKTTFLSSIKNIEKKVCPALAAGLEFLDAGLSTNRAIVICAQILKLYSEVELSQKMLYDSAYKQLRASIDRSKQRRVAMQSCQLLIDLPHFALATALPKELLPPCQEGGSVRAEAPRSPSGSPFNSPPRSPPSSPRYPLKMRMSEKAADRTAAGPKTRANRGEKDGRAQRAREHGALSTATLPGEVFPFAYHRRVDRWLSAITPLDRDIFPEYALRDEHYQSMMIAQHRFASLADRFYKCGIVMVGEKSSRENPHRRFILPAELIANNRSRRGVIIWSVDAQGICYHRFFHPRTDREVFQTIVLKTFRDADFPELVCSLNSCGRHSPGQKWDEKGHIEFDRVLRIATVRDDLSDGILKLFLIDADERGKQQPQVEI